MKTGEIIKKLRKERGWNQTELGEKIGLSFSGIASIEQGRADPTKNITIKLAEIFEVSTDYLLTGKEEAATISADEQDIIELYRKDSQIREALKTVINIKKKMMFQMITSYQKANNKIVLQ